ncbi:MAG: hypothetical protein GY722_04565 [bacterium]|nr:hypothetical protein [bacterium]
MTPKLAPFALSPVLVEKPWGGRRLEGFGKELPAEVMIGESWEVADLPAHVANDVDDPQSLVASGPMAGRSLQSVIEVAGDDLLGGVAPTSDGRFPLLVKLLDAREHLSVQVHPHERYVAAHPEARLKAEAWYVVDADPGSVLFHDVVADVSIDDVGASIGTPSLVSHLRALPATPGSFHSVPPGLIHSLGAGVMVAEVQTPSDTTFRLYDWADEYSRLPRQMHFEAGAASIVMHPPEAQSLEPTTTVGTRELTSNDHFWMREHRHEVGAVGMSDAIGPRVLMVISGLISVGGLILSQGSTAIVPAVASAARIEVARDTVFLEIGLIS